MSTSLVVAVDGPSGSGKSSTARGVADRLHLAYLDTGAMYRAMTWAMLQAGVDLDDPEPLPWRPRVYASIRASIRSTRRSTPTASTSPRRFEATMSLRAVSHVAAVPAVREQLVALQRATIADNDDRIVVEGRDIGSTVAPDADFKFFLVADPAARAARRAAEVGSVDTTATEQALARRDEIDSTRAASPLAKADDAVLIDSTYMTLEEVIDTIVGMVEKGQS